MSVRVGFEVDCVARRLDEEYERLRLLGMDARNLARSLTADLFNRDEEQWRKDRRRLACLEKDISRVQANISAICSALEGIFAVVDCSVDEFKNRVDTSLPAVGQVFGKFVVEKVREGGDFRGCGSFVEDEVDGGGAGDPLCCGSVVVPASVSFSDESGHGGENSQGFDAGSHGNTVDGDVGVLEDSRCVHCSSSPVGCGDSCSSVGSGVHQPTGEDSSCVFVGGSSDGGVVA